jgi:competence protein ComEC
LRAVLQNLLEETNRWRLWIPVALGTGIAVYFWLPVEPSLWVGWTLSGIALAFLIPSIRQKEIHPGFYFCSAGAFCVCLGFAIATTRTACLHTTLLNRPFRALELEADVISIETAPHGARVLLENIKAQRHLPPLQRVHLTWRSKDKTPVPALVPGVHVRAHATLLPIKPPTAPGSFDFRRHAFFQRVSSHGFLIAPPIVLDTSKKCTLSAWFSSLRFAVNRRIERKLPPQVAAIACALTTGEKSGISPAIRQHFSDSGTAHILAISGLHMTLVGGVFFLLLRFLLCCIPRLATHPRIKKWAAVASWIGTFGYLGLSGAAIPSMRAFLMHTIVTLAVLLNRVALSMFSVSLAAVVILLTTPEALISPGFQMSFAAVVALIAAYEHKGIGRFFQRRWLAYIAGLAGTSFIASMATTPFSIYTFQQCSLISIPANMLAVPLTGTWIMPCAVGALLLMPFGKEEIFLKSMEYGIQLLMKIAQTVASWHGAHLIVAPPQASVLCLGVFGALWITFWHRCWRWWGLFPIGIAFLLYCSAPFPDFMIDAAATCVGARAIPQLLATSRNRARTAQKVWSQRLGSSEPFVRLKECAQKGLWCFSTGKPSILFVTDGRYQDDKPKEANAHIDLSGRFHDASLGRLEILSGLGGYVFVRNGNLTFQSVRQAVGERPWSFKGSVIPPNASPRKNASKARHTPLLQSRQTPLDDDDNKEEKKGEDHAQFLLPSGHKHQNTNVVYALTQ